MAEIQMLKTPSGDAMMVVHIDKESLQLIQERGAVVGIFENLEVDIKLPKCLARYDRFKIREDLIVQPGIKRIR